ncbi:HEPN domain-containing protein [Vibrio vulnificus]
MFTSTDEFSDNIDKLILHLINDYLKDDFIRDLVKACDDSNPLYKMVQDHLKGVVIPARSSSKESTFTDSIISLYGFLESYLEKLVEEYITSINEASIPIAALPSTIRERHLELSMSYIQRVTKHRLMEGDDKFVCEKEVIEKLNGFLQGESDYSLNCKAFSGHTNFNYDSIQKLFAQVGIEKIAERTLGLNYVTDQLAKRLQQEPTEDTATLKAWLESELRDLSLLRNAIAHGAFEGTFENTELIIDRAEFLKQFGIAVGTIVLRTFEELVFHGKERQVLGNADKAYAQTSCFGFKGKVLGADDDTFTIKVGDEIYAHNAKSGDKLLKGSVQGIMLNKEPVDEMDFPNALDCGIKVDFVVASTMTNREISVVKAPLSS